MTASRPSVIGGVIHAPANPRTVPVPLSAPHAFAARTAALRLAAITLFAGAKVRAARGDRVAAAERVRLGAILDMTAKRVDQAGAI